MPTTQPTAYEPYMTDVNARNAALRMTDAYSKPSATYFTAMPNKLKLSARKLANSPGPKCLRPREKMVQYANEEYHQWKNHEFSESDESNDDAFARAKQN
jgi:hypothetical protein